MRTAIVLVGTAALGALAPLAAAAQPGAGYPNRPIQLVMPNAPGSSTDTMGRIVSSWYEALPAQSTMQRLVGVNLLAFMTLYRGAPDHARYSYARLPPDDVTAGRYTLGWRDWIIGISYLWEGQVDLAARKLRTALASAEEDSGRRSPISVTLASALAAAQWDRNEPEDAAALLADRLNVLERRAPPDAIIMGYVTAARVAVLAGDEQRALELLDHLQVLGEARRLPRLRIASRILLGLLDGRRTVDELVVAMQAFLADAGLTLPAEAVTELTHRQLWLFARQGLLLQRGGGATTRRSG